MPAIDTEIVKISESFKGQVIFEKTVEYRGSFGAQSF